MTQTDAIQAHLLAGHCLDPMTALTRFGCFRLAARVAEIRERGHPVLTRRVTTRTGKRIAVYYWRQA
jgi:hypothetical protein